MQNLKNLTTEYFNEYYSNPEKEYTLNILIVCDFFNLKSKGRVMFE